MSPAIISKYPDSEFICEHIGLKRVVVAYASYAGEKVTNTAPPETDFSRHAAMLSNWRRSGMMNIVCPLDEVFVAAFSQTRKQREL